MTSTMNKAPSAAQQAVIPEGMGVRVIPLSEVITALRHLRETEPERTNALDANGANCHDDGHGGTCLVGAALRVLGMRVPKRSEYGLHNSTVSSLYRAQYWPDISMDQYGRRLLDHIQEYADRASWANLDAVDGSPAVHEQTPWGEAIDKALAPFDAQ